MVKLLRSGFDGKILLETITEKNNETGHCHGNWPGIGGTWV